MQNQLKSTSTIEKILLAKGFYQMDDYKRDRILQLLEISLSENPFGMESKIENTLTQIVEKERQYKSNYFEGPNHASCPLYIKLFLSEIIRELIDTRRHNSSSGMQSQNCQNSLHYPYFPYPLFPIPLYPQHAGNPINQKNMTSVKRSYNPPLQNNMNFIFPEMVQPNYPLPFLPQNNYTCFFPQINEQFLPQRQKEEINHSSSSFVYDQMNIRNNSRMIQQIKIQEKGDIVFKEEPRKSKINGLKKKNKKEKKNMMSTDFQTDLSCLEMGFKKIPKTYIIKKKIKSVLPQRFEDNNRINNIESQNLKQNLSFINEKNSSIPLPDKIALEESQKHFLRPLKKIQNQNVEQKMECENSEIINENPNEQISKIDKEAEAEAERNPFQIFDQISQSHQVNQSHHQQIQSVPNQEQKESVPVPEDFHILEKCLCNGKIQCQNTFTCGKCNNVFHNECFKNISKECPICLIRKLEFYEPVQKVIKECYFSNISNSKFEITFDLQPYEEMKSCQKDRTKDIQIRCFRLEPSYDRIEISWPDEVILKVNGRKITQTYGLLKNSIARKRKDNAYAITSEAFADDIRKEIQEYDNILFEIEGKDFSEENARRKKIDNNFTYLFGVYLIERIKPEQLYRQITENELKETEQDYMSGLYDIHVPQESELAIEMITCRLQDPYTRRLIDLPVRGAKCQHAQCFDLKSHLGFIWTSRIRTWKCPVCSKQTLQFKVDRQQLELIQRAKLNSVIPEEVIYYKGEIFFKVNKNLKDRLWNDSSESENYKEQNKESKTSKKKQYSFLHYHPILEMTQVSFTPQLVFNKPERPSKTKPSSLEKVQSPVKAEKKPRKKISKPK